MRQFVCDICGEQDIHPYFRIEFLRTDGVSFGEYITCGIMCGREAMSRLKQPPSRRRSA